VHRTSPLGGYGIYHATGDCGMYNEAFTSNPMSSLTVRMKKLPPDAYIKDHASEASSIHAIEHPHLGSHERVAADGLYRQTMPEENSQDIHLHPSRHA
jgi:hypothetical protein